MNEGAMPTLVLWVGPKHAGKTTAAARLAERARDDDFSVAGLLAPSRYRDGELIGFDVVDIHTGRHAPLAECDAHAKGAAQVGAFTFTTEGLRLGSAALSSAAALSADLVIVDEFGPLEMRGDGWRETVDRLISRARGVILLIVRQELAGAVGGLLRELHPRTVFASRPGSIVEVIELIRGSKD
jgi:nucleoside-triphosphatase THEP1